MDKLLFSINLFHQYYDNGRLQNVSLVADQRTKKILDRYGLIARLEQGIYSIYYLGNQKLSEFGASLQKLIDQQALVFSIQAEAQHFTLISELPLNFLGTLTYSSSNIDKSSSEAVLMLPVLSAANVLTQGVVAEIVIHPDDLFDLQGKRVNTLFSIEIDARKTQWNYYLFNSNNTKLLDPQISGHDATEFASPTQQSLDGNDNVLLFSSGEHRFEMSETAKYSFDLINTVKSLEADSSVSPSVTQILVKGLPTPNINDISIQSDKTQNYACSQMYVYL